MAILSDIFNVTYGNKFDLNKMKICQNRGINFIGRTAKNNGVVAHVEMFEDVEPYSGGQITVALGGSILSSFLQNEPFYTAQNVAVLDPLVKLNISELLYYCTCIEANRYKYSAFGREANVTLSNLEVPGIKEIPLDFKGFNLEGFTNELLNKVRCEEDGVNDIISNEKFELVPLDKLFEVSTGIATTGLKVSKFKTDFYSLPMIRPSYKQSTSISGYVNLASIPSHKIFPSETLYVSTNGQGSHTYSYVSPFEFTANSDVSILTPIKSMSLKEKLYYSLIITSNRYKFSYGRKPKGEKLKGLLIPNRIPDEYLSMTIDAVIDNFSKSVNHGLIFNV